jgi:hypothetical protein
MLPVPEVIRIGGGPNTIPSLSFSTLRPGAGCARVTNLQKMYRLSATPTSVILSDRARSVRESKDLYLFSLYLEQIQGLLMPSRSLIARKPTRRLALGPYSLPPIPYSLPYRARSSI